MTIRLDDEDEDDKSDLRRSELPLVGGPIQDALFKSRTVLLFGEIDMKIAERTVAQLLALAEKGDHPIRMIINSPGGHVEAGDTIHDAIRFCGPPVKVIGTGWVASAGALIYLGAEKENRYCLPNTRFMLHQPLGGVRGQASDISIQAEEIIKMRKRVNAIIADRTGQPVSKIEADTDRDFWMSAEQAVKYGIVAKIVQKASEI